MRGGAVKSLIFPVYNSSLTCTIPVPTLTKLPTQSVNVGPAGQIHPLQEYLFQNRIEVPVTAGW